MEDFIIFVKEIIGKKIRNQTGNLIKQLEVFEGEERIRIKKATTQN